MTLDDIVSVAVLGAGTMGAGIAGVFARAGYQVRLADVTDNLLGVGLERLRRAQQLLVDDGALTPEEASAALARIRSLTSLEAACDGVQLVVEAVPEVLPLKLELFARFDRACPAEAVLTSNSSGLSITRMASATRRPGLVAGLHFWNPPHLIPLVEVTKGQCTTDTTASLLLELCRGLGKQPILVQHDVPGFVGNRLQFAVLREALYMLSEGIATAEDIDTAMTAGPGRRFPLLGPLRTADLAGLDVFHAISAYLFAELSDAKGPSALFDSLVAQGKLGAKTGAGFYEYSPEALSDILSQRDRLLRHLADLLDSKA